MPVHITTNDARDSTRLLAAPVPNCKVASIAIRQLPCQILVGSVQ